MAQAVEVIDLTQAEPQIIHYNQPIVIDLVDDDEDEVIALEPPVRSSGESEVIDLTESDTSKRLSNYYDLEQIFIQLEELFPKLDNERILNRYNPPYKVDEIVDDILSKDGQMPRKIMKEPEKAKKNRKRKSDQIVDDLADEILAGEVKCLKLFLDDMAAKFEITDYIFTSEEWKEIRTVLGGVYNNLKFTVIDCLKSCGDLFSILILGFFIHNKFLSEFKSRVNIGRKLKLTSTGVYLRSERSLGKLYPQKLRYFQKDLKKFIDLLKTLNIKYPGLIDVKTAKLREAAKTKLYEPPEVPEKFECIVCFQEVTISKRIKCCDENIEGQRHEFCFNCIREQANATIEEMPLADGASGLKCMETRCKNAIVYEQVRKILPKITRKRLDTRIQEESIAISGIQLDHCKNCNYAVEMSTEKSINKVLSCLNCGKEWCRICEREWDDDHFGLKCEEIEIQDKSKRLLESKMNEAVIRRCHRCNFQFMKLDGCNKITCRCGATICYLCRKQDVSYNHYCQHARDQRGRKCTICNKCGLWYDPEIVDKEALEILQQGAENLPNNHQLEQIEYDNDLGPIRGVPIPRIPIPDLPQQDLDLIVERHRYNRQHIRAAG